MRPAQRAARKGAGAPTGIGAPEGRARGVSSLGLAMRLLAGFFGGAALVHHRARHQAGVGADLLLDLVRDLGVLLEERLGVLAALADALAVVGEPSAGLLHHAGRDPEVDQLTGLGDA